MIELDELLNRLEGVRRRGDTAIARCPAHKDRSPSLSLRLAGDKILLCCHAGCATSDICEAVGIKLYDLFEKSDRAVEPPTAMTARDIMIARIVEALNVLDGKWLDRDIGALDAAVPKGGFRDSVLRAAGKIYHDRIAP